VCGYDLGFEPWYDEISGEAASHEICPSCGIQFGYDDVFEACGNEGSREELQLRWREEWISTGMKWNSVGIPQPLNWNPNDQLRRIRRDL
jgi:hypothetical protein